MESFLPKLLDFFCKYGPGGLIGVVFLCLYLVARRETKALTTKLTELSIESVKADSDHAKAYEALSKAYNALDKTMQCILQFLGPKR